MSKIILPPYLKVSDSSAGVKQEHKYALRILSKSARFSETVLKLLSTFRKTNDTYHLIEEEINALFITLSASTHYLQAEYAKIVVKRSFDEETSRLFNNRSLQQSVSTKHQNCRGARSRFSPNSRRPARSTHYTLHQGYWPSNTRRGRFPQNCFTSRDNPSTTAGTTTPTTAQASRLIGIRD